MKRPTATIAVFRSVLNPEDQINRLLRTGNITRPPLNVPYVVDNLWEWVRPDGYPSRRFSAFASPQPDLAKAQGPQRGEVCKVEFRGNPKICQVKGYRNARDHPDCTSLPTLLFKRLGEKWVRADLESKSRAGRLWIPTLSKTEVNLLFREASELMALTEELSTSIRFWMDAKLIDDAHPIDDAEAELFFEAPEGYYLRPLSKIYGNA